jgi:predicted MFS family arabinose efflux permease
MYLAGGLATLITLTYFGRLADRFGKLLVFRWLALATVVSVIMVTNLPSGLSLALVLAATTFMFIATSGRMVPATALLTATAAPAERGGFMSVNAAVQHIAAGAAAWIGGMMLQQENPDAPLVGYPLVGVLSVLSTLASIYLAGRLRAAPGGEVADESSEVVAAAEAGAEVGVL